MINPVPAKISRPQPLDVLARTRLFRALDRARAQPVVWITAPPGAGKTTLVSHYLAQRKLKNLWYQVDAGDADVAALFYYLALAAKKAAPRSRKPLPQLAPEYLPNLSAFFRLFFQALFSRWKTPPILVFDNYQEVDPGATFHEALSEAIAQIPTGGNLFIMSRNEPPAALARAQVNGLIARLDWGMLKLTAQEAQQLVDLKRKDGLSAVSREQLYALSEGWVAGLLLLLETSATQDIAHLPQREFVPQLLFDYFGSQIFDRMDADTRDILVQSAFLPKITTHMVERLTDGPHAALIVQNLHQRNYFIVRHGKDPPVYQYHPLFREFLLARAHETLSADSLIALQSKAAGLLLETGEVEDAAALLRAARDWHGLGRLIKRHARAFIAEGRTRTVEGWLAALPRESIQSAPWLLYWSGICRLPFNPRESRERFEAAFGRFDAEADRAGAMLAWAGIVDTFIYEWSHFAPLDRWIETMERMLAADASFPSAEVAARVASGMFMALMYRRPDHPRMGQWTAQVRTLVLQGTDVRAQMLLGNQLLLYYTVWVGDLAAARLVLDAVRPPPDTADTVPLAFIAWCSMEAGYRWFIADYQECLRAVNTGLATAERSGVGLLSSLLVSQGVVGALTAGDFDTAERLLGVAAARSSSARLLDRAHYCYVVFLNALHRDITAGAIEYARQAVALSDEAGVPFAQALYRLALAQALFDQGDRAQALACLAQARRIGRAMRSINIEFGAQFSIVLFALDRGKNKFAVSLLRKALALARERGYINRPLWTREVMVRLFTIALQNDIEVEFVRRLIRERRLLPEGSMLANSLWPWPLKIHTLGGFRIEQDGEPIRFTGKIQRRPLDLLKITIALGGHEVDTPRIIDGLWPEAEGDAAADALAAALRRLRLLLGDPAALVLQDNKLSIDSRRVWVDVWALEYLLNRQDSTPEDFTGVLALYQGAFLEKESGAAWAWPLRERLRHRFLREIARHGQQLMQDRRCEEAIRLFEAGLEADHLAEELYCNLMRCYQALGRRAEALSVYERCHRILAATLGVAPAPETEALHRALRGK